MQLADLSGRAMQALIELAIRRPALTQQQRESAGLMARKLRAFMYPKQAAFFQSKARWRATSKTRRAGATAGGCRELLARAIERPGFRATYAATTRDEARSRAWKSDTKSGLVDLLEQYGTQVKHPTLTSYDLGGVRVDVRDVDSRLEFSNGSQLELFGFENEKAQRKKRGGAKHVFWIDEAQDFIALETFIDAVALAAISDFVGELWVSGTPGRDCTGMFYDITKDPSDGEEPLKNWEVHVIAAVDNPFFGRVIEGLTDDGVPTYYVVDNRGERHGHYETREEAEKAAVQIRWDNTAGEAMTLKGWNGTEPDFIREWLGKWVKEDARYVYPIHAVPEHQLLYAPQRLTHNPFVGSHERFAKHPPWYDHHAAVADLPRPKVGRKPYQWLYAIGVDFGYNPDPFALVLWAFCMELPDVYEMFSWKCTEVATDDQGAYMKLLWDATDSVVSFVGDPAGKSSEFPVWQRRMGMPVDPAEKHGKEALEEFLASDIRRGRIHLRRGSPLHLEMKHLVYLPTKPGKPRQVHKKRKVGGIEYGDHCCFVGCTMIETSMGPVPIADVRVGDLVMTRCGLKRVADSFSTGRKQTFRLVTSAGVVVGTGDHPIMTGDGWKPLASLTPSDMVFSWASTAAARASYSTAAGIGDTQTQTTERHGSTSSALSRAEEGAGRSSFIEQFGKAFMARFRRAIRSITLMVTHSTTTSPTSSPCQRLSTNPPMQARLTGWSRLVATSKPLASRLRSGIAHLLDWHGMQNTGEGPCSLGPWSLSSARCVAADSRASSRSRSFAATHASRHGVEAPGSTTSPLCVRSADESLREASTPGPRLARARVVCVERGEVDETFNLTVDEVPEFFANGILVHNCDAGRYSYTDLTHYLSKEREAGPPPGSPEAMRRDEVKHETAIEREDRIAEQLASADAEAAEYYEEYQW